MVVNDIEIFLKKKTKRLVSFLNRNIIFFIECTYEGGPRNNTLMSVKNLVWLHRVDSFPSTHFFSIFSYKSIIILGKDSSSWILFIITMSNFPSIISDIELNLFRTEFTFRCPKITFLWEMLLPKCTKTVVIFAVVTCSLFQLNSDY